MSQYNIILSTSESTVVTEYEPQKQRSDAYQSEAALEAAFIKMLSEQGYEYIQSMNDIKMEPDILQNGDELFFPIFSNCEQMGEDYGGRFSKVEKHTFEAMNMAMARENVVGLVLDAFTQPFVIKKDLFEIIGKLPTNIDEE